MLHMEIFFLVIIPELKPTRNQGMGVKVHMSIIDRFLLFKVIELRIMLVEQKEGCPSLKWGISKSIR